MDRTMLVLLIGVLLTHLGTYMVIPILPIMFSETIGLSLGTVGMLLATYSISFQFGSMFGGFLADRIGRRIGIGGGALIGAVGFGGLGLFSIFIPVLLSSGVAGFRHGFDTLCMTRATSRRDPRDSQ